VVVTGDQLSGPHYDLKEVQSAFRLGGYAIPNRVRRHMDRKGWSDAELQSCIEALGLEDFHKSQPHLARAGVWLDIYRPVLLGRRRYLNVTEAEHGSGFIVLSFCMDGEAH
jgi:hypothetical protein